MSSRVTLGVLLLVMVLELAGITGLLLRFAAIEARQEARFVEHMDTLNREHREMARLLRLICLHTAPTLASAGPCLPVPVPAP